MAASVDNIIALPGNVEIWDGAAWVSLGRSVEDTASFAKVSNVEPIMDDQNAAPETMQFRGTSCRLTVTLEETCGDMEEFLNPLDSVTTYSTEQEFVVVSPSKPKGYLCHNEGQPVRFKPISGLNASASTLGVLLGNALCIGETSTPLSGNQTAKKTITIVGMMTSAAGYLNKYGQQSRISEWASP